ncbi:CERS3 synthase, partial [Corythaeola cristata]|nr:CERS3 synthase [Corythaeola cristata]
ILKTLNSWFWWENIWMPVNVTWAHFVDRDGLVFPKPHQLYATIPYAFVLLIIRFLSERYVAIPLAKALGIKNVRRVKPQPNPVLESYFRECSRHPSHSEIQGLAKKCNCTVRLVEKWFRRRRNLEIPTVLQKFREALLQYALRFYLTFELYLLNFYDKKPWFYDIWQTWVGYPFQTLLPSQYWYYMAEISFYWSLLFTLGIDNRRKASGHDFLAHVVHHLAAIGLMSGSWCGNYVRLGTLVMFLHDTADFWLEVTLPSVFGLAWNVKLEIVVNSMEKKSCTITVTFFFFRILRATLYQPTYYSTTPVIAYFLFNGQLLILQGLHLYWGYLIFKILKRFIFLK